MNLRDIGRLVLVALAATLIFFISIGILQILLVLLTVGFLIWVLWQIPVFRRWFLTRVQNQFEGQFRTEAETGESNQSQSPFGVRVATGQPEEKDISEEGRVIREEGQSARGHQNWPGEKERE